VEHPDGEHVAVRQDHRPAAVTVLRGRRLGQLDPARHRPAQRFEPGQFEERPDVDHVLVAAVAVDQDVAVVEASVVPREDGVAERTQRAEVEHAARVGGAGIAGGVGGDRVVGPEHDRTGRHDGHRRDRADGDRRAR
jgi:hypothetical protein